MADYAHEREFQPFPPIPSRRKTAIDGLLSRPSTEPWAKIRDEMQVTMMDHCGVYRTDETLTQARDDIAARRAASSNLGVQDKGSVFNTGSARDPRARQPARPGRGHRRRRALPAPRAEAPTPARTSPTATTTPSSSTRFVYKTGEDQTASITKTSMSSWSRKTASEFPSIRSRSGNTERSPMILSFRNALEIGHRNGRRLGQLSNLDSLRTLTGSGIWLPSTTG